MLDFPQYACLAQEVALSVCVSVTEIFLESLSIAVSQRSLSSLLEVHQQSLGSLSEFTLQYLNSLSAISQHSLSRLLLSASSFTSLYSEHN